MTINITGDEKRLGRKWVNWDSLSLPLCFVFLQLSPPPQYIEGRLTLYEKLKAEHDTLLAERATKDSQPIKVTLPDGKVVEAESWKTTPYQVACGIR